MDLSIVVISKGRQSFLRKCLYAIFNQVNGALYANSVEILISVVDESEIDTAWLNENNIYNYKTTVIIDPDNQNFNRSRARNKGITAASGKRILFVDCDILLNREFLSNYQKYISSNTIGIHYLYGYKIGISDPDAKKIKNLKTPSLKLVSSFNDNFMDYRELEYELCSDNLNCLKAPWVFAWSCVLSIPKDWLNKVGGFDERFYNWGGEDSELAFNLFKKGAKFTIIRDCFGVHIPHKTQQNRISDNRNKLYFYQKHTCPETEISYFFPTYLIEKILGDIQQAYLFNMNLSEGKIDSINNQLKDRSKSLAVGIGLYKEVAELNFDTFLVVNPVFKGIEKLAQKNILNKIGLITDFDDNCFDVTYVFDSFQFLPEELYEILLKELHRISKEVIETDFVPSCSPFKKNRLVGSYINRVG